VKLGQFILRKITQIVATVHDVRFYGYTDIELCTQHCRHVHRSWGVFNSL